ncbi:MAG: GNAT family N-acetyltransferase [Candidatus Riflebacteria bacterium]|nr:GNAT family N-acetyltransferase [Candidatus Riflebacteria bacterium]
MTPPPFPALILRAATPATLRAVASWPDPGRPEERTCRPVVAGKRLPPGGGVWHLHLCLAAERKAVGRFTWFDVNPRNRSAEFGYLVHPAWRGKGLGLELVRQAVSHLFRTTRLNKLYCQTAAFNLPSVRVLERLGFHLDGRLREHHELDGVLHDDLVYSMLRREWPGRGPAVAPVGRKEGGNPGPGQGRGSTRGARRRSTARSAGSRGPRPGRRARAGPSRR